MRRIIAFFALLALVLSFAGCESDTPNKSSNDAIDYYDAVSFENALNDGKRVKGKIVCFSVEEYAPDSILGINCHAGEHLNFLFDDELTVSAGDSIVVRVTGEPSKVFLLDSWKIPCEFLRFNEVENTTPTTLPTTTPTEAPTEAPTQAPTVAPTQAPTTALTEPPATEEATMPENMAGAPDVWFNLLEKHYEDVKKQFEEAGFTNIVCVAHEIDYNENNTFEGSVVNIAIGENREICVFEKGEQWPKDIKIEIDYRVKPAEEEKPASAYEMAFVRAMNAYSLYYMFDTDNNTVVYFGTNDTYVEKGTYTGDFASGVTINWSHGEWTEKFINKKGSNNATMIDGYGFEWEYRVCSVEEAQNILDEFQ